MKNRKTMVIIVGIVLISMAVFLCNKYGEVNPILGIEGANGVSTEVVANVLKGNIVQKYTTKGRVISQNPEIYVEEIELVGANSNNFSMLRKKGEDIKPKEDIYIFNGRKKSIDYNGKILDVTYSKHNNSVTLTILNYDKLYIITRIDAEELKEINHETQVNIVHKGVMYTGKISLIDYEIENGEVTVKIVIDGNLYPGSDVYVDFIKKEKKDSIYISEKAVLKKYGQTYAILSKDGEENKQIEITTGETFYEKTNEDEEAYVEVTSGLKEGDLVVINQYRNELNVEDL